MGRLSLQSALFAAILSVCGFASAGSVDAGYGRINILVSLEGDNAMRLGVTLEGAVINPANCDTANAGFALQLNAPGRSAEETRMLFNNAQLAFMTGRRINVWIRDDLCYTMGGYPHRVVSGITVLY